MSVADRHRQLAWKEGQQQTPPPWLAAAHLDPVAFWAEVGPELVAAASGTPRSSVFEWYTLFHEFGGRHAVGQRACFSDYSPGTGFHPESYSAVTRDAANLAHIWRKQGVGPGSTVCLCVGLTATYATCLLAAWWCGAAVCDIPPDGRAFVRNAVDALVQVTIDEAKADQADGKCVFAVCGTRARPWLQTHPGVTMLTWDVPAGFQSVLAGEPHRYEAGEVAARFFSELSVGAQAPVSLSAEQLYLGALRDGLLLLGLEPGLSLAAPGFSEVQYSAALVLSCMATGAHYIEIGAGELGDGAAVLGGQVDVLGVAPKLRALLLNNEKLPASAGFKTWFRDLAEDTDAKAWGRLAALMAGAKVPGMTYWANSAAGGSILFSPRCPNPVAVGVWASPGLPCQRTEPNGTTMPALADVALLSPSDTWLDEPGVRQGLSVEALGHPVTTHSGDSDVWVTNLGSHRCGRVLPEMQMESLLLRKFSGRVRAAVLVTLPTHSGVSRNRVILLVYTWPSPDGVLSESSLLELLREEFGHERAPDKLEVLELNPLLVEPSDDPPVVDRLGCASQYISGTLWEKSRAPVFRQLAVVAREVTQIRAFKARAAASTLEE